MQTACIVAALTIRPRVSAVRLWVVSLALAACLLAVPAAGASVASPAWAIRSLAQPTVFSAAGDAECEASPQSQVCDSYTLLVTNVGSQASSGPVTIADTLPPGLSVVHIEGEDLATSNSLPCTQAPVRCVDEAAVPVGDTLRVRVDVVVEALVTGSVTSSASVAGGGAPTAETSQHTAISSEPALFGIAAFAMHALDAGGAPDARAGGHPYSFTTSFDFTTVNQAAGKGVPFYHSAEDVKDVVLDLPLGLAVDPRAAPRCPLSELQLAVGQTACPAGARVGTLVLERSGGAFSQSEGQGSETTALYNLVPAPGSPLELGATYLGQTILMYGSVVRTASGYGLRLVVPEWSSPGIIGLSLTLFGDPATRDRIPEASVPLFANPVDCSGGPLPARLEVDTWQHPGQYHMVETLAYPDVSECDALLFEPVLSVAPETTQADEPSGYELQIQVPQEQSQFTPATPELKQVSVTLPAGVSLSLAAMDGLVGCAAMGPEGINLGSGEVGPAGQDLGDPEASELGPDGLYHTAAGHCPLAATVGTVEIFTPLLDEPLEGHLFLAQPQCDSEGQPACTEADAGDGRLLGLYLEAAGSGVIVKLAGRVSLDPATGQLTMRFDELPQLPMSELRLHLQGGPRALLANPQTCGTATASSDLSPWSSPVTPDAEPLSSFNVDWNGMGGACPGTLPFEPSLNAGVITSTAGSFSPLMLTISRADREHYLSRFGVRLPPGLAWMFSSVPLCGERQASQGTCSSASEIGTTQVAVGAGPHPFWLTGLVYLTEGYRGAPYGLSVVVRTIAGPFDLGTVLIRAAIGVDPSTGALTISPDPLPQVIDGIPLRIRTVEVAIKRPEFVLNPTICATRQITAMIEGAGGASVEASNPFVTPGCQNPPPTQAGPGTAAPTPSTGSVSLAGTRIMTTRGGEATVKLTWTGSGTCRGKLTLTAKTRDKRKKKHPKTTTIATATFSIPPGKTTTINLKLNRTGRALLSADHGRLSATLTILKSSPVPSQTHAENVHLVQPTQGSTQSHTLVAYEVEESGIVFRFTSLIVSTDRQATVRFERCLVRFHLGTALWKTLKAALKQTNVHALAGNHVPATLGAEESTWVIVVRHDTVRITAHSIPPELRMKLEPLLKDLDKLLSVGERRMPQSCSSAPPPGAFAASA